ncbi:MAG: hypothetical protein IPM29_25900 [Planctomycetes bacterium]|nr:hypothetical protein [Planctomycetota bacterium]
MATPDRSPEPSPRRVLAVGCLALLGAVGGLTGLGYWLWTALPAGAGASRPVSSDGPAPGRAQGLTRFERTELEGRLAEVERELTFARGQARLALDPTERGAWQARVAELEEERATLRERLGR